MEIEDFETIHLAQEIAREKGWEHVMETIRRALAAEKGESAPAPMVVRRGLAAEVAARA